MLFILLKLIWIYDLLFYCLCISTVILLGLAFYRYRSALAAIPTKMSLSFIVIINSDIKKITADKDKLKNENKDENKSKETENKPDTSTNTK